LNDKSYFDGKKKYRMIKISKIKTWNAVGVSVGADLTHPAHAYAYADLHIHIRTQTYTDPHSHPIPPSPTRLN
jgi:hypothetical protein